MRFAAARTFGNNRFQVPVYELLERSCSVRTTVLLRLEDRFDIAAQLATDFTNNATERFEFWSLGFLQRFSLVLLFSKADLAAGLLKHLTGAVSER